MKLHFSKDWLKRHIENDSDLPCEAGSPAHVLRPSDGMCNCRSYNRPEWGGTDDEVVLSYGPKTVCVDACIVDQVSALWAAGIGTLGCCCSHNGKAGPAPSVVLSNPNQVATACEVLSQCDTRAWQVFAWSNPKQTKTPPA